MFSAVIAECEGVVADLLGDTATLTTKIGIVRESVKVIVKTSEQAMGDDGQWSGRYANNLGNGLTDTHFIEVPIDIIDRFEGGHCVANGKRYALTMLVGENVGFNVYSAIEQLS